MQAQCSSALAELLVLRFSKHGILEEGAGAAAILVAGHDEHGFVGSDMAHRLPHFGQAGCTRAAGKVFFQVGVLEPRLARGSERKSDAQDDVAAALAGAVGEAAGRIAKLAPMAILQVNGLHAFDDLRDFLAIGAHILHRRPAHAAGNAAEALDAGAVAGYGASHKPVPLLAGSDVENE